MRASAQIAGHTDSVLCCEVLHSKKLLASGGEVGSEASMCAGAMAVLPPLLPPPPPAAPPCPAPLPPHPLLLARPTGWRHLPD